MSRIQTPKNMLGGGVAGHIAALVTVFMWGYSFVSTKVLLDNGLGPVLVLSATSGCGPPTGATKGFSVSAAFFRARYISSPRTLH